MSRRVLHRFFPAGTWAIGNVSPVSRLGVKALSSFSIDVEEIPNTPEVASWMSRVTSNGGTVSISDKNAVNIFVSSISSLGLNDSNSRINLFAGNDLQSALVPIFRGGGPDVDTGFNLVSGDYSRTTGITGNGSNKYLDTGVVPSSFGIGGYRHVGVYVRTAPAANGWPIGAINTNNGFEHCGMSYEPTNSYVLGFNTLAGVGNRAQASLPATRLTMVNSHNNLSGTNTYLWTYNGSSFTTGGVAGYSSNPAWTRSLFVFGFNNLGTASGFYQAPLGGYTVGPALSNSLSVPSGNGVDTYYSAWQTVMTAFGRNV